MVDKKMMFSKPYHRAVKQMEIACQQGNEAIEVLINT